MRCHQGAKVKHFDFSNVIYHKFSHGAISYTLNGENVNVMLEFFLFLSENKYGDPSIEQRMDVRLKSLRPFNTISVISER